MEILGYCRSRQTELIAFIMKGLKYLFKHIKTVLYFSKVNILYLFLRTTGKIKILTGQSFKAVCKSFRLRSILTTGKV